MSIIPQNVLADSSVFSNALRGVVLPSVRENRFWLIDEAAESYRCLYEMFLECLSVYGFADFQAWINAEDDAPATAALNAFLSPAVCPEMLPLDGILEPVKLQKAKQNLIVWCLHRNLGGFDAFCEDLRSQNWPRAFSDLEKLAFFRISVREDARNISEDEWLWPAQKQNIWSCIEGSNRSRQGRELEKRAREALQRVQERGGMFRFNAKEQEFKDSSDVRHRVDLVIENDTHILLIHMKSSQKRNSGYSMLYSRDTLMTSQEVRKLVGPNRRLDVITIFAGVAWDEKKIMTGCNPVIFSNLVDMAKEEQVDEFEKYFLTEPLMAPFLPKDLIQSKTSPDKMAMGTEVSTLLQSSFAFGDDDADILPASSGMIESASNGSMHLDSESPVRLRN